MDREELMDKLLALLADIRKAKSSRKDHLRRTKLLRMHVGRRPTALVSSLGRVTAVGEPTDAKIIPLPRAR
jgi:hypothetical protein